MDGISTALTLRANQHKPPQSQQIGTGGSGQLCEKDRSRTALRQVRGSFTGHSGHVGYLPLLVQIPDLVDATAASQLVDFLEERGTPLGTPPSPERLHLCQALEFELYG